ncbi:MAG: argininosuccinate lyase [Elusimicrobia bacterium]|nr:argininosuccinate lyase [Elusimicrobiota bacterium]
MKKLWQTDQSLDAAVEAYTVGRDPELDARLLPYEVYGSLAHAAGLVKIGVLKKTEYARIREELGRLLANVDAFTIAREQEDIHTAVEQALTAKLGDVGAKVHAGRSRNDQVQVNLRLFLKDRLLAMVGLVCETARAWEEFGRKHEASVLPGYTHIQRAMPTTIGHWAASHAEAMLENARTLRAAIDEADACPLGSAAGYGVPLPLRRDYVAKLLGFSRVQRNTLRVQSSRPRVEAAAVSALALLARDLGVLAWDLSLYSSAEFGFVTLDKSFTTGSSIMPQKKNPDVVELTRARAALFPGWVGQILAIGQLPSGYHRDYQLTKGVLFDALDTARDMTGILRRIPASLTVNAARCAAAITEDMLATHEAVSLVKTGMPFRRAYRQVAEKARSAGSASRVVSAPELPAYAGAPGNPGWSALAAERVRWERWQTKTSGELRRAWSRLVGSAHFGRHVQATGSSPLRIVK